MESEKKIIHDNLKRSGWQITKIGNDEWWIREMWQLACGETTAFVTFLVDPADMEKVWAVLATKEKPLDYAGEVPRFVLPFEKFEADLGEFADFVTHLRKGAA